MTFGMQGQTTGRDHRQVRPDAFAGTTGRDI